MKNAINYYYNLFPDDIHQTDKLFYFDKGQERYILLLYEGDVNTLQEIYNLHVSLLQKKVYVHQILLNKDGQIVTLINGLPYILLKVLHYKEKIDLNNVLSFSNVGMESSKLEIADWGTLWSNKNDHMEYQISQLGQKHPIIRESFSYYIGLGETSIQLVNTISKEQTPKVIAHRRISKDDTVFELYNPLNLIIDTKVRDVAEYFKNSFFKGENINDELNRYLMYGGLNTSEHLFFLARMLYPTYYFDLYGEIISGKTEDEELKKIIDKVDDYELVLKHIYQYYKTFLNIPPIEWLER